MAWITLPLAAVVAGAISFSSPCCIPLVPSYLSFLSGLPMSRLGTEAARSVTLRAALLFVAGFTLVFTALGASSALAGAVLLRNLPAITRVAGVGIIGLGLAMAGVLRVPWLAQERRLDLGRFATGPKTAFPVGMAFAFGWVPCIGPVLATVLTLAAATETVAWGALLLAFYSLGLGVPFVLLALGYERARSSLGWLRRHARHIEVAGGLLLVGVGVLFVTGTWLRLFIPLQREFARLGWPPV
jgi:cytochrome c-type biogenesis protein